jgi:hypothetical protein
MLGLLLARQGRQTRLLLMLLRGEGENAMLIQDVLTQEAAGLTTLEASDKELLADFAAIQAQGGTLTDDQAAQAAQILARIGAVQAADDAAVAAIHGTPVGDEPLPDDGTTPAGPVAENTPAP